MRLDTVIDYWPPGCGYATQVKARGYILSEGSLVVDGVEVAVGGTIAYGSEENRTHWVIVEVGQITNMRTLKLQQHLTCRRQ